MWVGLFIEILPGLLSCALGVFSRYVKLTISAGLNNTKDYPLLLPPSSLSSLRGLVLLTSNLVFLLLKDALGMPSVCGSRTQRPYRAPREGLIVLQGVRNWADRDHCPSLGAWGQLGAKKKKELKRKEGGQESDQIIPWCSAQDHPCMCIHLLRTKINTRAVISPRGHLHGYFNVFSRRRAPNPLAGVTRGSA